MLPLQLVHRFPSYWMRVLNGHHCVGKAMATVYTVAKSFSTREKIDALQCEDVSVPPDPVDLYYSHFKSRVTDKPTDKVTYKYAHLLPTLPIVDWGPAKVYNNIIERGLRVPKTSGWEKGELSRRQGVRFCELTPAVGTEILGLDLRSLSDCEKNELALMVAERGAIMIRDQPDFTVQDQSDLVQFFGPLYRHVSSAIPADPMLAHVSVIYTGANASRPPPEAINWLEFWHSDGSYERQPPGFTCFKMLTNPSSGGDTMFASGYALYDSLSRGLRSYLETLNAVHVQSGATKSDKAQHRHQRRPPVESIYPVVHVHPATGWKSIYIDPASTRNIVGVPKGESEMLLEYLFNLIGTSPDVQVRFKWADNSVGLWDNRSVLHSPVVDYWPERRHAIRVMAIADCPRSVTVARERWGIEPSPRVEEMIKRRRTMPKVSKNVTNESPL